LIINKLATKKGIQGIFNLTNVPKFDIDNPTENAKKRENIIENVING
jgi:hypothetical protein